VVGLVSVRRLVELYFCVKVGFLSWLKSYWNVHWVWFVLWRFLHEFSYCFRFARGSKSIVFDITVAFLRSVGKRKETLALNNIQESKGQLYRRFRSHTVEFFHFSPFLRVFYAVLSTRPVQKSPTRFLRIFQYQEDPKISYAIPTRFSVLERYKTADQRHRRSSSAKAHCSEEVTGKYVVHHLLCSIFGRINQTVLGEQTASHL